jgi:dipeptidyl aminopeptidase/acylaminoacyl peptidase
MENASVVNAPNTSMPPPPRQRITPRALLEVKRLSDPKIHPDGRRVAFVVTEADFEESRWVSHLWLTEWLLPEDSEPEEPTESNAAPTAEEDAEYDPTRQLTFSHDGETHPKWSPDGRYLAFLSTRLDETEPAPDEDEDDEPKEQVWILPIDGGEARKVTSAPEGVLEYEWTPDSSALIFLAPEPRVPPLESLRKTRLRQKNDPIVEHEEKLRRQFWSIDIEECKPHLLFTADYGVIEFALSPDGEQLCYTTNYTGDWNDYHLVDLWVLDLNTRNAFKLIERPGGKYHLHWSPEGTQIAFLSWLDPQLSYSRESLFVTEVPRLTPDPSPKGKGRPSPPTPLPSLGEGSRISPGETENSGPDTTVQAEVTPFPSEGRAAREGGRGVRQIDSDIKEFQWSGQKGTLIALAAERTGSAFYTFSDEGVTRLEIGGPESECEGLEVDREGNTLAFVQETATTLPEICMRAASGEVYTLTRLNAEFGETYHLPRQEIVTWTSPDGTAIEGVLTYPLDYQEGQRCPLIVQIHGGPKSRATVVLQAYSMPPVWSAEGYAVLQPNYRGSEGYGNAFAIASRRDLGRGDFADILTGVDHCIAQGIADPERLGIMGGSYGGFLTNWAIGHTDRFRAAISLFGIFHLQTDYSNSDLSRWDTDYLGAAYWEDPEIYHRLSPGSYVQQIKTPTLILHGDEDTNTFISNSKELYQALRQRGVTTQFVHYPREGHGLQEPNHRLDEIRRCLAWMDRFVRSGGQAPTRYRVGDKVLGPEGLLELHVTSVEIGTYFGQPSPEAAAADSGEASALLEITLTINSTEGNPASAPLTFALYDLRLEPRRERAPDETAMPHWSLRPVGIPMTVPGGKVLVEGEALRLVQHPDAETGRMGFGCTAVFRVPGTGGDALLHVADFPPVAVSWTEAEENANILKTAQESARPNANDENQGPESAL